MKGVWPSIFLSPSREKRGEGCCVSSRLSCSRQRETIEGDIVEVGGGGGEVSLSPSSLAQGAGSGGSGEDNDKLVFWMFPDHIVT